MPGGNVIHVGSIRMRVIGSGDLQLTVYGLDPSINQELMPITMASPDNKEPSRIANFMNQRVKLRGEVTELNEWFKINTIIFFAKPVYKMFPE